MILVGNYLNNLAKGKQMLVPILFHGGVASNRGIVSAFANQIDAKIVVPENHKIMGAIGVALIALQSHATKSQNSFLHLKALRKSFIRRIFIRGSQADLVFGSYPIPSIKF